MLVVANGSCASGNNEAVSTQETQDYLTKEVEDAFNQLGVSVREGQSVAVDAILTQYRFLPLIVKS